MLIPGAATFAETERPATPMNNRMPLSRYTKNQNGKKFGILSSKLVYDKDIISAYIVPWSRSVGQSDVRTCPKRAGYLVTLSRPAGVGPTFSKGG